MSFINEHGGEKGGKAFYDDERLPNLKFYQAHDSITGTAQKRPTIIQLHGKYDDGETTNAASDLDENSKKHRQMKIVKLGWVRGVMVRCLLALFGAIMFLRLPWVMGNAGIIGGSAVIIISGVISILTSLSLASVATNGKVKAGGTYFLLSRTLGPEFGGPIGVTISATDLVSSAMVILGVAEAVKVIVEQYAPGSFFVTTNGLRVIGFITLICLAVIILIGLNVESAMMLFMLTVLAIAFANFFVGLFLFNDVKVKNGFTGFKLSTIRGNVWPAFSPKENFITVFGVFFPAMTGILAGVNISGNLKKPQVAIPRGTLWATSIATSIYFLFGFFSCCVMTREASNKTIYNNSSYGNMTDEPFGLKKDLAMLYISGNEYLVYAGTFAATISSASAVLVSGPKVFQAICRDKIFPSFFEFFAVGRKKNDEPVRLYLTNFVLSACLIAIGNLNKVAHLLTNFVLLGYVFINFACFYSSVANAPGWRPTFRYYNKWVALLTAIICVVIMFLVEWTFALLTICIEFILYMYVKWRKPNVNWGSSSDAYNYLLGLKLLRSYSLRKVHTKNFRPQCLILSGPPQNRRALVKLINQITKSYSLSICANIITSEDEDLLYGQSNINDCKEWLINNKLFSFYTPVVESNFRRGVRALMQCCGFGEIKPNILVMGFKNDWRQDDAQKTLDYFEIIHDTFDMSMAIIILRVATGLETLKDLDNLNDTNVNDEDEDDDEEGGDVLPDYDNTIDAAESVMNEGFSIEETPTGKFDSVIFMGKQSGYVDIWWLFEDGGLTLLFPYLLCSRKMWRNAKLRIFIPSVSDSPEQYIKMANMLKAFRLKYSDIKTIGDFFELPSEKMQEEFEQFVAPCITEENEVDPTKVLITRTELKLNARRTERNIRLKELLLQHSKASTLIFVTLPIPRREEVSAALYLSWLDFISKDLPPVAFIRGNQENVLTYYA